MYCHIHIMYQYNIKLQIVIIINYLFYRKSYFNFTICIGCIHTIFGVPSCSGKRIFPLLLILFYNVIEIKSILSPEQFLTKLLLSMKKIIDNNFRM